MKIQSNRTFNSLLCGVAIVGLFVIGTNAYAQQEKIDQLIQSAEQGDANAQFALGVRYQEGEGVPRDDVEGAKWLRLAAEQGRAAAQHNLGFQYQQGLGVPQDYIEAHKWFNLAASQLSGEKRDLSVSHREYTATMMTLAQIAEAQRFAREWAKAYEGN